MSGAFAKWCGRYLSRPEAVALAVILVTLVLVFKLLGQILAPVAVGGLAAYLLAGMVTRLVKLGLPRNLAVGGVFTLFISITLLVLLWLLPLFWSEAVNLAGEIPNIGGRLQTELLKLDRLLPEAIFATQLQQLSGQLSGFLGEIGREIVTFSLTSLVGVVTVIVYLVLVPLLIFFFLRDGEKILDWIGTFLPRQRGVLQGLWQELQDKIHGYVRGKFIEAIIVAVVTVVAFKILGLRYAPLLGAAVGISVVVPYVGIVVVTVPIVVVGLMQWGWSEHFFYLMLVHGVISILDANLLVPLLFSEIMNLHPLAIVLAVLVFGNLFGFWGVFFAIPLTTLINIMIKSWPRLEPGG